MFPSLEARDILFVVLAFCALWFTAFICWLIYQVAMILKNVNDTVSDARASLGKIETAISGIRGRFDHAASALVLIVDSGRRILEYLMERKDKKVGKKK